MPSITSSPRESATRITPLAIEEKYGSVMSWMMSPTTLEALRASAWAWAFGV